MKQEIIQSALQIAQREGWSQVTTRRITKEFGYTTSAIYHYLGGKDQLLTELQRQGFIQLKEVIQAVVAHCLDDPKKQLRAVSVAFWEFAHHNRALYQLMFGLASVSCQGSSDAEVHQAGHTVQKVLSQLSKAPVMGLFLNWWALVSGFVAISFASSSLQGDQLFNAFRDSVDRFIESL